MAMLKCTECGGDVSSTAAACPQCGRPLVRNSTNARGCVGCLLIIAMATALVWLVGCVAR